MFYNKVYELRKILLMKRFDLQRVTANYELLFYGNVQDLVIMRKNLRISQEQMALKLNKSLKTIQNFEAYKCKDYFLIFAYKEIFKQNK